VPDSSDDHDGFVDYDQELQLLPPAVSLLNPDTSVALAGADDSFSSNITAMREPSQQDAFQGSPTSTQTLSQESVILFDQVVVSPGYETQETSTDVIDYPASPLRKRRKMTRNNAMNFHQAPLGDAASQDSVEF